MKKVYVSSKRLQDYGILALDRYTEAELMDIITNKDKVLSVTKNPKKMYKGRGGHAMAATMIQKNWRRYCSMRNFKQLKFLMV